MGLLYLYLYLYLFIFYLFRKINFLFYVCFFY